MSAALTAVALRLGDEARQLGLAVDRTAVSRCAGSPSTYLQFHDAAGRRWILRISDHAHFFATGHEKPHYDLVFRPGERAEAIEAARGWLARVAEGLVAWSAPAVRRARERRR